jgi:tRNA nucleotidyltransferase/poly(A) polymerase
MRDIFHFKEKLNQFKALAKGEYKETLVAAEILLRVLQRKAATKEEVRFLKHQSVDCVKILGVLGLGLVSSLIPIALHKILSPHGINILPTSHKTPMKQLNEYKVFLDDLRDPAIVYKNHDEFVVVRTFEEFKDLVNRQGVPSYIAFDHDLGEIDGSISPSGYDAAKWLVYEKEADIRNMQYACHSDNVQTRVQITGLLDNWKKELNKRASDNTNESLRLKIRDILLESDLKPKRIKLDIPIPPDIDAINRVFLQNNHQLYLVGGCVRDAVMGSKPKDFDLATDALPDRVEQIMGAAGFRTLPTGKAFGIINVITDNDTFEVATFRKDGSSSDSRRPDSVEFTDMAEDAFRRDLSVNALYYDLATKEVIDLVGGLEDIKNSTIRTVGNPEDRFAEDRLRILRCIRFSARMDHDVSPEIDAALRKNSSMQGISMERIRDEFIKGIHSAKSVVYFLTLLDRYNLFRDVFPSATINKNFIEEHDHEILIAWLLRDNAIDATMKVLQAGKYSVKEMKCIKFLLSLSSLSPNTAYILKKAEATSTATKEQVKKFGDLIGLPDNLLSAFLKFQLSVSGADLQGVKPGPEMGVMIKDMETKNFLAML